MTAICTRCGESLVNPEVACVFCVEERRHDAVTKLVAAAKSTSDAALLARVDAIDTLREHPLGKARAEQEASKLKSSLSELVYQGIIARLSEGKSCHADDLEPIFPPEHRALCRRLTGAQFGSLASRRYIVERTRRKSSVPSRKAAKSGVFEFTQTGREKLVGHRAGGRGEPGPENRSPARVGECSAANATPSSVSGEQSATRVSTGAPSPKGPDRSTNPPVPSTSAANSPAVESPSQLAVLSLLPEPDPELWAA